jgi:predicted XRE-type DNA-binding protein
MTAKIIKGSGNIFTDLGFEAEEASNLKIRSDLMMEIERVIARHRWSQAKAAEKLGVSQPRISDLKRGKVDLFSVDTLINMLNQLGEHVTVCVVREKESFPRIEKTVVISSRHGTNTRHIAIKSINFGSHLESKFWQTNVLITAQPSKPLSYFVEKKVPQTWQYESTSADFSGVIDEDQLYIQARLDSSRCFQVVGSVRTVH